jgi:hypothetical protein
MKIGLYNLEPNIVNSAMMRMSSWHKAHGDNVDIYMPLARNLYDTVYAFSLFNFTPKTDIDSDMICGGTGFDLTTHLQKEIEDSDYDWNLFPDCDFSLLWFSSGCFRKCPFCIVHKKENGITLRKPKNLNPNGKYIKVMDDNFFGHPAWTESIVQLKRLNQPIEMLGIDARILSDEMILHLKTLKHHKRLKSAWDNPLDISAFEGIKKLVKSFPSKVTAYVLIGYNSTPEQDLYRVEKLREIKVSPFVMPYNKKIKYQRNFARWVNHKAIFHSVKWSEYKKTMEKK